MLDTCVYRGADIDSDHRLVMVSMRLMLKSKSKCMPGKVFNIQCLKQLSKRCQYRESVHECFDKRTTRKGVESVQKELKEAAVKCAEKHRVEKRQPQKQWIPDQTIMLVEVKHQKFAQW